MFWNIVKFYRIVFLSIGVFFVIYNVVLGIVWLEFILSIINIEDVVLVNMLIREEINGGMRVWNMLMLDIRGNIKCYVE